MEARFDGLEGIWLGEGATLPVGSVVLAAHPDDETLGAAILLSRSAGCQVVHLTDGAPRDQRLWPRGLRFSREDYALLRARELVAAMARAGIGPERLRGLGVPDQEAVCRLGFLARRVAALLETLGPPVIVTHPYEGGHPDHDAAAFVARAAVTLLRRAGHRRPGALLEMTSYHRRGGGLVTSEFLPAEVDVPVTTVVLTEEQRRLKQEMLACFASQREVLAQFTVEAERFRLAPPYDFTRAPHPGILHFEALGWPTDGERWRQAARRALHELGLAPGVDGWH